MSVETTVTPGDARPAVPPAPATPSVLACYLALDTSDSMSGPALDAAGAELARLWDAARDDPRLATSCRLSVVTFDAVARVHVPLTRAGDLRRPPRLAATRPATNYQSVLELLRGQIAGDLADLRAARLRPLRPAVFLLTDGRPTRGHWPPAHAALTHSAWPDAPDVVAFGFGAADEIVVRRLGTAGAYLPLPPSRPGPDLTTAPVAPAGMLAGFMSFVLATLGGSVTRASSAVTLPQESPRGWQALPAPVSGAV